MVYRFIRFIWFVWLKQKINQRNQTNRINLELIFYFTILDSTSTVPYGKRSSSSIEII